MANPFADFFAQEIRDFSTTPTGTINRGELNHAFDKDTRSLESAEVFPRRGSHWQEQHETETCPHFRQGQIVNEQSHREVSNMKRHQCPCTLDDKRGVGKEPLDASRRN